MDIRLSKSEYRLIWVGPDGTVQMCYVTFKLGNLHENRLSEMLFSPERKRAAKDASDLRLNRCLPRYIAAGSPQWTLRLTKHHPRCPLSVRQIAGKA